ncbi:MAG: 6-carboxytetrahydropterin synthase [Chloroherpetonaceae bacterium]|nr:6-carboxytetrahydropterin synthase [Chloroherpetonaceae bacterium]MDW8438602.1 6-carboxytetrahydropterin synthase [Chloroherpetonaceae bacterium]
MTAELLLKFEFVASHSLPARPEPHPHLWRMEVVISGEPKNGMIINLLDARKAFEGVIAPLSQTFLNENPLLDAPARATPTCETLGGYFFRAFEQSIESRFAAQNPTLKLKSVQVAICEPDGYEWGAAKLSR